MQSTPPPARSAWLAAGSPCSPCLPSGAAFLPCSFLYCLLWPPCLRWHLAVQVQRLRHEAAVVEGHRPAASMAAAVRVACRRQLAICHRTMLARQVMRCVSA
ncbi:hypothetical protein GHT07_11700 [Caenimonas koreensis DSM 17982]|uniref:Uncharacterized protein n=1 Tax=Caenimonas koreensis DSM 17982 TaxID=1121255 RepID=A0A844B905_9BURK|nr:hypothetical protein [Caenimonas koreensis DSM 17982]